MRFPYSVTGNLSRQSRITGRKGSATTNTFVSVIVKLNQFKSCKGPNYIPGFFKSLAVSADITSVKSGLSKFYKEQGRRFVSTHPMFGPTFANVKDLSNENAIIIKESDEEGKAFFREFYDSMKLKIHEYTFKEHDETIAYSLSIPFSSTMVFAACMKQQDAPGTTFKKHQDIASGLLSEDDYLLTEILFSPYSQKQVERIKDQLGELLEMISQKDKKQLHKFFGRLRKNIGIDAHPEHQPES